MKSARCIQRNMEGAEMGARQKLNGAYGLGSAIIALLVGGATGSFAVFLIVLVILLASNLASGEIRPRERDRRKRK